MAQRATAQHGTAWHSSAQHGMAHHGMAQHAAAWHGSAQRGAAQHGTAQLCTAWRGTARRSSARRSVARHSVAQRGTARHSTWRVSTALCRNRPVVTVCPRLPLATAGRSVSSPAEPLPALGTPVSPRRWRGPAASPPAPAKHRTPPRPAGGCGSDGGRPVPGGRILPPSPHHRPGRAPASPPAPTTSQQVFYVITGTAW